LEGDRNYEIKNHKANGVILPSNIDIQKSKNPIKQNAIGPAVTVHGSQVFADACDVNDDKGYDRKNGVRSEEFDGRGWKDWHKNV
jgi:hypothetical protein